MQSINQSATTVALSYFNATTEMMMLISIISVTIMNATDGAATQRVR
jgi:hypothetical protein